MEETAKKYDVIELSKMIWFDLVIIANNLKIEITPEYAHKQNLIYAILDKQSKNINP
jgi:hypothetical protein